MYIGLYDQDLALSGTKVFPSLEMMLLSSYYKKKGVVDFIFSLEDTIKYDKVYINRSKSSLRTLPPQFFSQDNLEWIGSGITGKFVPLPKHFYSLKPDRLLYEKYFLSHKNDFSERKRAGYMKILNPDYTLLRITQGENILFDIENIPQNKKIILFDDDLFNNPQAEEIVEKLKTNQVYFMHRLQCKNLNLFLKCQEYGFKPIGSDRTVVSYHGPLTKNQFLNIIDRLNVAYCLGVETYQGNMSEESFVKSQLSKKGNFFMYARSIGKRIPIIDSKENKLTTPCARTLNRFCSFTQQTGYTSNVSFLTYIGKCDKIITDSRRKMMNEDSKIFSILSTNLSQINGKKLWKI